jgi:ABC-type lipoprotein release transport system permease subunit
MRYLSGDESSGGGVLVAETCSRAGFSLGDDNTLLTPQGESLLTDYGFFDLGVQQLKLTWVITDLNTAQSLFGYDGSVNAIEIPSATISRPTLSPGN